jgi:peptide/nickel transport system substrate-binding protein
MRRRDAAIAVPMLVIAIGAGACGSSSSGATKGNGPATSPTTSVQGPKVPTEDINPKPVSDLKQGGTMTWSLDQYSTQWNVNQLNGLEASTVNVMDALMPVPELSDSKADISFDPNYWTSAKLISNSPQTIEYKLNPKAKWSDGVPITEADFAAQWGALNGKNKAYQPAGTTGYDQISSVTQGSGGKYDVIVKFSKPFSEWQSLFSPLYPAKYQSTPKAFNTGYLNQIPVTAGPFKFGSFNKSAQNITVVPDPNWWGANKPVLSKIVFQAEAADAASQAFANGELDYDFDIAVDPSDYKAVKNATGGHTTLAAGPDLRQFTFNSTHGAMKDEKVRQAIVMGIDRNAIIKSDLQGIPWPAIPMDNHFFVNTQAGYVDNSKPYGTYNPTAAANLLKSDGYTKSGQFFTKGGQPLSITFTIPAGIASSKNEGELFQAMMTQLGIKAAIKSVPVNDFFDKYIIPGNFDVTPFSYLGTPFPISSSASIYLSPKNGGDGNYTGTANPAVDNLIHTAEGELNLSKARADLNQADKLLWQEVHTLTIFQRPSIDGVNDKLANVGSFGFATPDYTKMGFMK